MKDWNMLYLCKRIEVKKDYSELSEAEENELDSPDSRAVLTESNDGDERVFVSSVRFVPAII